MESIVRASAVSAEDPFKKVKTMIDTMYEHLSKEMAAEASHKAYCDRELSDTTKSKEVKTASVEKLTTKVDSQSSESMNLKEQVALLQKEVAGIMTTQKEIDAMRKSEHAQYLKTKPELEMGQEGVKKSLQVLRQYYAQDEDKDHDAKEGAGGTIIHMLEVVESDFAKSIASIEEMEQAAQAQYEEQTHENEVTAKVKQQEVIHKGKTASALDKDTSETSTDLDSVQSELDAVNEYFAKIQEECLANKDPYEDRRKRHEVTLQGLKDAHNMLSEASGAAFTQQNTRRLRGGASQQQSEESEPAEDSAPSEQEEQA
jgi:hypothetical protein